MILITGGTGTLGPSVAWALCREGYDLRILALDKPEEGILPDRIDIRIGDITDKKVVKEALIGVDSVIHMAALLHINNPKPKQMKLYKIVNIEGTKVIVNEAIQQGIERFIFFSTINVYGDTEGQIVDENSLPKPKTPYAQSKYEAEQIVLSAKLPDGRPIGTVLRLAAVYGSRIKGNYKTLFEAISKGIFIPLGQGLNRKTLVYEKDVAEAVLAVLNNPFSIGKIYNVTDGNIYFLRDILDAIYTALGKKMPRFSLPVEPLKIISKPIDRVTMTLSKKSSRLKNLIEKYTEDVAVEGLKIKKDLGFRPNYDLINGWTEVVDVLKQRANK